MRFNDGDHDRLIKLGDDLARARTVLADIRSRHEAVLGRDVEALRVTRERLEKAADELENAHAYAGAAELQVEGELLRAEFAPRLREAA